MASFPGQKGTGAPLPNAPVLSAGVPTSSTVPLTWTAVAGATTYNLYQNGMQIGSGITSLGLTVTGLSSATQYAFYVTGVSGLGEGSRSNPVAITTTGGSGQYKFTPAYGMASNGVITKGSTPSSLLAAELSALKDPTSAQVVHYRVNFRWNCFEDATPGPPYDFSQFDNIYTATTGISSPGQIGNGKKLSVSFETITNYSTTTPVGTIPNYILTNSSYGPGTGGTFFGYWQSGNTVGPALWRANVMTRFNLFMQYYAAHLTPFGVPVDQDPNVEMNHSWEITAPTVAGMDYTDSGYIVQCQNWASAMQTFFPHTMYFGNNNYVGGNNTACAGFTTYLQQNRGGITSPDCFGLTSILNQAGMNTGMTVGGTLTCGYRAYLGSTIGNNTSIGFSGTNFIPSGLLDLRGNMPCAVVFESPETTGASFHGYGSPWTPQDFYNMCLSQLSLASNAGGVSHVVPCFIGSPYAAAVQDPTSKRNTGTNPGNWGSWLTMMAANPNMPSTVYPKNLP